jgi:hypothetical protein
MTRHRCGGVASNATGPNGDLLIHVCYVERNRRQAAGRISTAGPSLLDEAVRPGGATGVLAGLTVSRDW